MASRNYTITQDGSSRTFTVNTGVGPQGPAGTAGTTSWSGLTGEANHIPFDTTPTSVPTTLGTLSWNAGDACLEYAVDGGTISIGKETFDYYTNLSGVTMVDGDIVSIVGATGNRTAVDLTDATDATSAANVIGMVTQGAANNGIVRVTKTGSVHSLNTNGLTEGGSIYVDPAAPGKWTMTRPTSPNHVVPIGVVQVAHAVNGVVDVVPNHQCVTAADIIDPTVLAQAGKPSRLFYTMKRFSANRGGVKPIVLSTLIVGDSWALGVDDYIKGTIGACGYLVGPGTSTAAATGATITTGKSEYAKTPWGQSAVLDATGEYVTWGLSSGGSGAAGRFAASRFLTVHYEAINGGGSFKVQYEDRTGTWTDVATINTNNSGSSTYTVWESSALSGIETPRVRTVWVSGSSKIYAVGAAANSANDPSAGTSRSGGIFCDVSYGGSKASDWDDTPQAAWTALLGWLKTDIVIVRERREDSLAQWETSIDDLVTKIRTARPTTDFVFIGSHPTSEASGAANDRETDSFLKTYCDTYGHLFVDLRSFFPTTYAASYTIGFQESDEIHATDAGKSFSKSVIWQHLGPIQNFIFEADPTTRNGPWFTPTGVQKQFLIQQDGNVEDAYFGTSWTHRGTTSPNPGIQWIFNKRDTSQVSEGWQLTYGGQAFWQMDSSNRHLISSTTSTLSRTLGGTMEVMSGQTARHALRVSGVSGQTAPIFEVRTGAAYNASGTLVAGYRAAGTPFATLATYADNAAALAGGLVATDLYKTSTGEVRVVV